MAHRRPPLPPPPRALRALSLVALLLLAGAGVLAPASSAHAGDRVLVLVEDRAEGTPAGVSQSEVKLVELLLGEGVQVVEGLETETARRTISVDKLLGGRPDGAVSALNADILVVGRVDTTEESIPYGVEDLSAVTAEWTLRALRVDTTNVVLAQSGRTQASGTQLRAASADARRAAATEMHAALKALVSPAAAAARPVTLAVSLSGAATLADVDAARKALSGVKGVSGVEVRAISGDATRLDVVVSGLDAWGLASALGTTSLEVTGLSKAALELRWAPARATVAVVGVDNATGSPALDWAADVLPGVVATELANSKGLRVDLAATDRAASLDAPDWADAGAVKDFAGGLGVDQLLVAALTPGEAAAGAQGRPVLLRLWAFGAATGAKTAQHTAVGPEAGLIALAKDAARGMDQALWAALMPEGELAAYRPIYGSQGGGASETSPGTSPRPGRQAAAPASPRPTVVHVALDPIYPARLAAYTTLPLGHVTLANHGASVLDGVRVRVHIPGVTAQPTIARAPRLAPGAEAKVPVMIALDADALAGRKAHGPATADVTVTWPGAGGADRADHFTQGLVVFGERALSWAEPESVAAFVTHEAAGLDPLMREATQRVGSSALGAVARPLRTAALVHATVTELGLRYQPDPANPFDPTAVDTVGFPTATLSRGAGDCDDLSVLWAALLEAQGVPAALVLTPAHVLVAFDTGLPAAEGPRTGLPEDVWIVRGGRVWLPVEATRLEGTFADAVLAGAAEVARHRAEAAAAVQVVAVRDAWRRFPPVPARGEPKAAKAPKARALRARLASSAKALETLAGLPALESLPKAATSADPDQLTSWGVQLVQRGHWVRAQPYLDRAIDLAPERKDLAYNRANIDVLRGRLDQAKGRYEGLSGDALADAREYGLAVVAFLQGRRADAKRHFKASGLPEAKRTMARLGLTSPVAKRARRKRRSPRAPAAKAPAATPFTGIRAGVDRVPRDELLLWLGGGA